MKSFTNTVGLWRHHLRFGVIDIIDCEVQLGKLLTMQTFTLVFLIALLLTTLTQIWLAVRHIRYSNDRI
ncbi:hypothetical protein [Nitrosomonas sp. Is37]|uniref:hypothetical protein n=1 Tax=Nitrosomonas sp. Is37 TaxID=3080535 RepID=UPI00294B447B|nr:hypothetical protein [Nitrosomonas sp. Is37]MDV6344686.1 hypothetical protein [Nitrosomonas sp. Is37]